MSERERERESISEDNANTNTYFEPLFLMSTTYFTSAIWLFSASPYRYMYDLPQYPFSARTILCSVFVAVVSFYPVVVVVVVVTLSSSATISAIRCFVRIECGVCLDADNRETESHIDWPSSIHPLAILISVCAVIHGNMRLVTMFNSIWISTDCSLYRAVRLSAN